MRGFLKLPGFWPHRSASVHHLYNLTIITNGQSHTHSHREKKRRVKAYLLMYTSDHPIGKFIGWLIMYILSNTVHLDKK